MKEEYLDRRILLEAGGAPMRVDRGKSDVESIERVGKYIEEVLVPAY